MIHSSDPIKAFCIDFNWGEGGPNEFARPGLWADASPSEHVAWCAQYRRPRARLHQHPAGSFAQIRNMNPIATLEK